MMDAKYKLLKPNLTSSNAYGRANVHYKLDEFVRAPLWLAEMGYHLLVFDSLYDVARFTSQSDGVYRCLARGKVELPPIMALSLIAQGRPGHGSGFWPTGTEMYKEVMILGRVPAHEFKRAEKLIQGDSK